MLDHPKSFPAFSDKAINSCSNVMDKYGHIFALKDNLGFGVQSQSDISFKPEVSR